MQDRTIQFASLIGSGKRKHDQSSCITAPTQGLDTISAGKARYKEQQKKQQKVQQKVRHKEKRKARNQARIKVNAKPETVGATFTEKYSNVIVLSDSEDDNAHPATLFGRQNGVENDSHESIHLENRTLLAKPAISNTAKQRPRFFFPDQFMLHPAAGSHNIAQPGAAASCHNIQPNANFDAYSATSQSITNMQYPAQRPIETTETSQVGLRDLTQPLTASRGSLPTTTTAGIESEPELCKEQADLVDLICSGRNVFYTGSAGCGKSTVLKAFVKRMRSSSRVPMDIKIIAPTGRAALDIGGTTSWTYAGWVPDHMKKPLKELRKLAHGKFVRKRLRETNVLVIDEISMMENHHFERLNAVMKEARESDRAFGGVQLIVTGDFCQLPPVKPFQYCITCGKELKVSTDGSRYTCTEHGDFEDKDKWAFRSEAWKECNFHHTNLSTIHRQSDDTFIDILQSCRLGKRLDTAQTSILLKHESNTHHAVRLYPTRAEVRRENEVEFKRLRSREYRFNCYDDFRHNANHPNLESKGRRNPFDNSMDALRDHRFDTGVALKQGMLVVLQINLDMAAGLVNGSQGQIVNWEAYDKQKLPKAAERMGLSRNKGGVSATPTVYDAPVLNGDHALIREENIYEFINVAPEKRWPIVQFQNGVKRTIYAHCSLSELGDQAPFSLLSRTQIPLLPAWAMSIHKAQGMTLNRVIVDLGKSFEEGQVYVALSRARTLEGLKVERLGPLGAEGGNPEVREFLRNKFGII